MKEENHLVFTNNAAPFNLNIIGVRNLLSRPDHFDDELHVIYPKGESYSHEVYPITTYPGIPYLLKPINPKGTAILVPNQYLAAYAIGTFRGYTALKQVRPVKVFRDFNRDAIFNLDSHKKEEGLFGIHIHKAGIWSKIVGLNSAGCQVFKKREDFEMFINTCVVSARIWGNQFTYTLIKEK